MLRYSYITVFCLLFNNYCSGQNWFSSPLNIPLRLSGTFCEVRTDHFHSGIDIKTNGHVGLPVFAVADGWISRVKVSAYGFGKVIYINHPNGFTTVYAHLLKFTNPLADSVEKWQYQKQSFEVEFFFDSLAFPVKQHQQIALSGNSGGSEAPHLHFEIRDRSTEEPLNPLLYGCSVQDTMAPVINRLALYNVKDGIFRFDADYNVEDTLLVEADSFAIAFSAYDLMNDTMPNRLGVPNVMLTYGGSTLYYYELNRFNFNETRLVNAHIDYALRHTKDMTFQRCFTLPGNRFSAFVNSGNGVTTLDKGAFQLTVSDANNNTTSVQFYARRELPPAGKGSSKKNSNTFSFPNKPISKKWKDVIIEIPAESFYERIDEPKIERVMNKKTKKPVIKIEPAAIALGKNYSLSFVIPSAWNKYTDKVCIAALNSKSEPVRALPGKLFNKKISASLRSFGSYTLCIDTTPPSISNYTIQQDSITKEKWLTVKISDNLNTIVSYEGCLNSNWALFEYDAKNNLLQYRLKDNTPGEFDLSIEVKDRLNNKNVYFARINLSDPTIRKE